MAHLPAPAPLREAGRSGTLDHLKILTPLTLIPKVGGPTQRTMPHGFGLAKVERKRKRKTEGDVATHSLLLLHKVIPVGPLKPNLNPKLNKKSDSGESTGPTSGPSLMGASHSSKPLPDSFAAARSALEEISKILSVTSQELALVLGGLLAVLSSLEKSYPTRTSPQNKP